MRHRENGAWPEPLPVEVPDAGGRSSTQVPPCRDEAALWKAAPLNGGHRNLRDWSPEDRSLITAHYLPLARQTVRRHTAVLSYSLPRDEFDSQAAEWLVTALTRYDPARGVPFAAYLRTKIHHWVIDLARAGGSGRAVNDAETAMSRARDPLLGEAPEPVDLESAEGPCGKRALSAAEKRRAVDVRRRLRHADALDDVDVAALPLQPENGVWTVGHPEDAGEPDRAVLAREAQRLATSALAHSAWSGDEMPGDNVPGLFAFVLIELDGHTKADVARVAGRRVGSVTDSLGALVRGAKRRVGSVIV